MCYLWAVPSLGLVCLMPKRAAKDSVEGDILRQLKAAGAESMILDLRLEFMELEGIARYLRALVGKERIHPRMAPTQASGRWSTAQPPRGNFPAHSEEDCDRCKAKEPLIDGWCPRDVRATCLPDPGAYWVKFDLDAIEGRFAVAYAKDEEELQAYRWGWDVHTILGACPMFHMPLPPLLTKACHEDPSCQEWRDSWTPPWTGGDDRRRHLAKTLKYATQFSKDYKGAGEAKGVEKLGLTKRELLQFARMYVKARPVLTACKAQRFEKYARESVAYTFRGRRRRLYGKAWDRAKAGWSHEVQGSVPDIMDDYIIQFARHPLLGRGYLVGNFHDGLEWSMPASMSASEALQAAVEIVERDWDVLGVSMPVSAEFKIVYPDGTVRKREKFSR